VRRVALLCLLAGCGPRHTDAPAAGEMVALAGFAIDRYEVTDADYAACVAAGACAVLASGEIEASPRAVGYVGLDDAKAYCAWAGKRLPSDEEWTAAAGARTYPWGDEPPDCTRAMYSACYRSDADQVLVTWTRSGERPAGATPEGVHDLAGNVAEWATTGEGDAVLRGSPDSAESLRTTARSAPGEVAALPPLAGIRCAR
jgi:formylglycine-generating enzyme